MSQQSLFHDKAANAEPNPVSFIDTRAAAQAVAPLMPSMLEQVRDFITSRSELGATDHEIRTALRMLGDTARRRILVKDGFVVVSGKTRPSPTGCAMTVWIAT
jgi:hypothetical protein